jgi:Anaerobic c4-dicarboxylate membrane transporter
MIIAVITALATLEAAGGLDYLVSLADRVMRRHPQRITSWRQWCQLDRENPGRSPNRDRCPPSPSQRPQTLRSKPPETSTLRPTVLDVAVARLVRLVLGPCRRETGNSRRLASQRFPILLDLEKPARASRETFDSQGRPRADPQHEQSQSALELGGFMEKLISRPRTGKPTLGIGQGSFNSLATPRKGPVEQLLCCAVIA